MSRVVTCLVMLCLLPTQVQTRARAGDPGAPLRAELVRYRAQLDELRELQGETRTLPPVEFFLFGMGERQKLLYRAGVLKDARTGRELRRWDVKEALLVPSVYTVALTTTDGRHVTLVEDEEAVWLEDGGKRTALTRGPVKLPRFADHPFDGVLRVLHQEVLINVVGGRPVPNFFVYPLPWYRDGAMMAMVLKRTGNLHLIRNWIQGLDQPFDRNNAGETEADNLGEALYLISLVSDRSHPLVPALRRELKRFETGKHIAGRSDFAAHPVYQTCWAKLGLSALGLDDPYVVPTTYDKYASLAWWADDRNGPDAGSVITSADYPYLTWAGGHATGTPRGPISDRDYPLTWEANASQAKYEGMRLIDPVYVERRLCTPHTWHAAEAFLDLIERRRSP